MRALAEIRGNQRVTTQNPEATYEALERMHSRSSEQVMRDFERHC